MTWQSFFFIFTSSTSLHTQNMNFDFHFTLIEFERLELANPVNKT